MTPFSSFLGCFRVDIEKNVVPPEFTTPVSFLAKPRRGLRVVKVRGERKEEKKGREKKTERHREIVIFHFSPHNTGTMTWAARERSIVVGKPDAPFASEGKIKRRGRGKERMMMTMTTTTTMTVIQKVRGKTSLTPFPWNQVFQDSD